MDLEKKVLVVGLARSGLSAANFLAQAGAQVTVTDRKSEFDLRATVAQLDPRVRLSLGGHRESDFTSTEWIILSPGVPLELPQIQVAIRAGIPVWSEVELAFRQLTGRVVGITGSNGKTTTTALLGEILRAAGKEVAVAGNIGTPLIGRVAELPPTPERIWVVELSSFQLESIERFHCNIALLLNLSPDHLDRYSDLEAYAAAKERILINQDPYDVAIFNADDPIIRSMAEKCHSRIAWFSRRRKLDDGAFLDRDQMLLSWQGRHEEIMPVSKVSIRGGHNLENVLAASLAAFFLGVSVPQIARAVEAFSGVEHRLELVDTVDGVSYFNDSKATNLDSTQRALESFDGNVILILGGRDKGGDFDRLREPIRKKVSHLIVIGESAEKISGSISDIVPLTRAVSMEEAVNRAQALAETGSIVLLSPACASFDMYLNYEERGKDFKNFVRLLKERARGSHPETKRGAG